MTVAARVRLRRALVRLGGLLMLALLSVTLLGLFSVWSLDRAHARSEARLMAYWQAVGEVRAAQIHFKGQVQEWKNLLLRGGDPARRAQYLEALLLEQDAVLAALDRAEPLLRAQRPDASLTELRAMREEHARVGAGYREALRLEDEHLRKAGWDASRIDARVLGLDRPLSRGLDALSDRAALELDAMLAEQAAESRARYRTLRWALWIATVVALVLVGGLLWRVLRERGGE